MQELLDLVTPLLDLCRQAGQRICEHYHAPGADQFQAKGDDSPLTRADLDSHALLLAGLGRLDPRLPVLSEESGPEDMARHRDWRRYWLVDPLDGTKEFLARTGEFTINIAMIADHKPMLGVLYQPLQRAACVGIPGLGAWRYHEQGDGAWQRAALGTRRLRAGEPLIVLASRRHRGERLDSCLWWLEQHWDEVQRRNSGSALKFCQLAEGAGDFYPRFSPCCEWDTAAGQALLEAAGGALLGLDGMPLRYNQRDTLLSPQFYALGDPGHRLWQRLLAEAQQ